MRNKPYTEEKKKEAVDAFFLNIRNNVYAAMQVTAKQQNVSVCVLKKWVAEERRRIVNGK